MRPTIILCLIFSSIAVRLNLVYQPQAAILHQRVTNPILDRVQDEKPTKKVLFSTNNLLLDQHDNQQMHDNRQRLYVELQNEDKKRKSDLLKSKFILLTSGDQIKLYPIKLAPEDQRTLITADSIDNNNYYIVKPSEFNATNSQVLEYSPDDSYKQWPISKSKQKLDLAENKTSGKLNRASILPDLSETDESYENHASFGWRKPLIIDVDYFVDENYCNNSTQFCLVVVWLDKNNKLVRYGSIDLIEALKPFESKDGLSKSNAKENILWLDEFPPIQVYRTISDFDICRKQCNFDRLELFSMVIDKRRKILHVAFSDGIDPATKPNKILTGVPKTRCQLLDHSRHTQLVSQRVLSFNKYPPANKFDENIGLQNLNVDEETADWLFYFDPSQAGKIFALSMDDQWSDKRGLAGDREAIQSLAIRNISLTPDARSKSVTNFAFDQRNRRMLLLTDERELLSCGISGEDVELVGRLSRKPALRSSYSMQVFENTLLISDSIKKSLIGVGLDQYDGNLKEVGTQRDDNEFGMTHQVLVIQMNSLYGFRIVDREVIATEDDLRDSAREANLNLINQVAQDIDDPNVVIEYSLGPKFLGSYSDAYNNLMSRSSLFYPESLDRWRQYVKSEHLKQVLWTFGLVACHVSLILLLICIYFIRRKRNRAKQDGLYKLQLDSCMQSNDPK